MVGGEGRMHQRVGLAGGGVRMIDRLGECVNGQVMNGWTEGRVDECVGDQADECGDGWMHG